MKKIFLLLLIISLTIYISTGCAPTVTPPPSEGEGEGEGEPTGDRVVLVELFNAEGCAASAVINPIMEDLAQQYGTNQVILLEEAGWGKYTTSEVQERFDWYVPGTKHTPFIAFNGLSNTFSEGVIGGGGGGYTPPPAPPEVKIPETTKIADEETEAEVIDVTPDYSIITFARSTTQLEGLEVGDILFIGVTDQTPYGLLRKVTNITRGSRADDTLTVSTEFTSIEEAVEELHFSADIVLTQDDIDYERLRLPPGVSISQDRANLEYDHTFNLNEVSPIYEGDPNTTIDDVTIDGEINLNYEMIFNLDIGLFGLNVEFRNIVESYTDLDVTIGGSLSLSDLLDPNPIHLFTIPFIPIPVAPLVVITPILYINLGLDGEVYAEMTVGVTIDQTGSNRLESGFEYNNGQWHEIKNDPVFDLEPKEPQLSLGGTIKPYAGPELEFIISGCAGVYGSLYGNLELQADINDDPWWSLYGGFDVILGAHLKILSFDLGEPKEWSIFNYREQIACADGPFTDIRGQISGSVKDAVTQSPLPDVSVKVYDGITLISSGITDSNSVYSITVPAGSGYRVEFTKSGYIPAIYHDVSVEADVTTYLETVLQIDDDYSGEGNISGTISNALTGDGVSGLTINLREGINVTSGTVIASAETESGGYYSVINLNAGYYTAEVSGTGYNTTYFTVICIGGTTTANQDATITPILSPGETRIILTWGVTPSDLDSHLTGPLPDDTRFHMYYIYAPTWGGSSPWPEYVKLDLDDVTSYGPETTTIYLQIPGVYRFSVHNYTNKMSSSSTVLSNSGAQVSVDSGDIHIATFYVPANQEGTLWTVFEMDGDTITPINAMSYESDEGVIRQASAPDAELMKNLPPKR
jgi:thiol-disulfide isomerase/thioredoxin